VHRAVIKPVIELVSTHTMDTRLSPLASIHPKNDLQEVNLRDLMRDRQTTDATTISLQKDGRSEDPAVRQHLRCVRPSVG